MHLVRVSTHPYAPNAALREQNPKVLRRPHQPVGDLVSLIWPGVWGNHSKVWTMRTLPEAEPVLPRASTSALRIASHRSLNARSAAAARVHSCRPRGFQGQLSRWLRPKARVRSTHRSCVEDIVPQRRSHKSNFDECLGFAS